MLQFTDHLNDGILSIYGHMTEWDARFNIYFRFPLLGGFLYYGLLSLKVYIRVYDLRSTGHANQHSTFSKMTGECGELCL